MPSRPDTLRLGILVGPHSSLALALLFRGVFERANRLLDARRYAVELISTTGTPRVSIRGIGVAARRPRGAYDFLVVPPYDGIDSRWRPSPADVALIARQFACGATVASACLGAFALAAAGILDGREATTHWSWAGEAHRRHPQVDWNVRRILCDQRQVITAGGYLAAIDLALHIAARTSSRATAHTLGRHMLADSTRQFQSIYAQQLVEPPAASGELAQLAAWVERHLADAPSAADLARRCNMSLRSFHRKFREAYGITPRKFVQLRRIEAVRKLLVTSTSSLDRILEQVGVSDRSSFRRLFQRELGDSPAEYRRRLRARPA